jgi:lipooligosaccharide transport system permease protein
MFLFSGTFFPISQLPDWLEPIAVITPLWHAVEMARRVALGVESTLPAWQHLGYLAALFAIGAYLSQRYFTQKMLP